MDAASTSYERGTIDGRPCKQILSHSNYGTSRIALPIRGDLLVEKATATICIWSNLDDDRIITILWDSPYLSGHGGTLCISGFFWFHSGHCYHGLAK